MTLSSTMFTIHSSLMVHGVGMGLIVGTEVTDGIDGTAATDGAVGSMIHMFIALLSSVINISTEVM